MKKKKLSEQQKLTMTRSKALNIEPGMDVYQAVVSSHQNKFLTCILKDKKIIQVPNNKTFDCVVGDNIEVTCSDSKYKILRRLPRQNELTRFSKDDVKKTMAANINQAVVMLACEPEPFKDIIAQYKMYLEILNINYIFVLNKIDLIPQSHWLLDRLRYFEQLGDQVYFLSCKNDQGIDLIKEKFENSVSIVIGPSGVGKSSFINALRHSTYSKVGDLSSSSKGGHTTSVTEFFYLNEQSAIIDSPGIRQFNQDHLTIEQLQLGFPEFESFTCKFRDCDHLNSFGCRVMQAIENGLVPLFRFEEYKSLAEKFIKK